MAAKSIIYSATLEEHASIIRGHHQHATIRQHILDQKQATNLGEIWATLDHVGQKSLQSKMEDVLWRPALTIDE